MTKLLLITHDAVLMLAYRARLQKAGFEVDGQSIAHDGLAKARTWIPDLILLDLQLPGLHGLDVLKSLRDIPRLVRVPVVLLIEQTLARDILHECLLWGADSYLSKERCSPTELVAHLHAVLEATAARASAPLS